MSDFYKAIGAGILISISCRLYTIYNNYIGAILFSFGLISILLLNLKLYTGVIGYVRTNNIESIINTFIGNCFGLLIGLGFTNGSAQQIISVKLSKMPFQILIDSIICGIIIYICVHCYKIYNTLIPTLIGVPMFILIGAEHSIADIGFFIIYKEFSLESLMFIIIVCIGNAIGSIFFNLISEEHNGRQYTRRS